MPDPLAILYSCAIGSGIGAASFPLTKCSVVQKPTVKDDLGRTGTEMSIDAEGWIEASDMTTYVNALSLALTGGSISGQDISITGLGGVSEAAMLAGNCTSGGPHVQISISDSDEPMRKIVKMNASGKWASTIGDVTEAFKIKTDTRPDGLQTITRGGELIGPDAQDYFTGTVYPNVIGQFPATFWVINFSSNVNAFSDRLTYSFAIVELIESLPAFENSTAVDGTASIKTERDEQQLLTTTTSFNLLITGDPSDLQKNLRPTDTPILRESMTYTRFKETRVQLEFVQIASGAGDSTLISWHQQLTYDDDTLAHTGISWPGVSPAVYYADAPPRRATQSGEAIAIGDYVDPPDPLYPDNVEHPGQITYEDVSFLRKRTSWSYSFVFDTYIDPGNVITDQLGRPDMSLEDGGSG